MCRFNVPAEISGALTELEAHYREFEEINRGANGYLFFACNRISNARVAIKFYGGLPGDERHDEPRQLSQISSPNVLPILDARNVSDEWAYFVTPRCTGGDLDDFIASSPSVYSAIDAALGTCAGASAIHACGMLHRDLKPANIVMEAGAPRIADFGSVKALAAGETETTASKHSVLFRPPESFDTQRYSVKGDVYQIGILVYQLLGGALPYDGRLYLSPKERFAYDDIPDQIDKSLYVDDAIRRKAQAGKLLNLASLPPWIGQAAQRSIRAMTCPDPDRRCGCTADVAAHLSRLRTALVNWRWEGTLATAEIEGRRVELRPTTEGKFEAFQSSSGGFRRIPGVISAPLNELVRRVSG
jgi:serine/threonine protein kinase